MIKVCEMTRILYVLCFCFVVGKHLGINVYTTTILDKRVVEKNANLGHIFQFPLRKTPPGEY